MNGDKTPKDHRRIPSRLEESLGSAVLHSIPKSRLRRGYRSNRQSRWTVSLQLGTEGNSNPLGLRRSMQPEASAAAGPIKQNQSPAYPADYPDTFRPSGPPTSRGATFPPSSWDRGWANFAHRSGFRRTDAPHHQRDDDGAEAGHFGESGAGIGEQERLAEQKRREREQESQRKEALEVAKERIRPTTAPCFMLFGLPLND